jgi:uncharacterized protein (TIGR03435 family)
MRAHLVRALAWGLLTIASLAAIDSGAQAVPSPNATEQGVDATSSFSIVRVKLSPDSEADDWGIGIRDDKFWAIHVTVDELIEWAYGINVRQIEHAQEWLATDRFDVDGLPDPGMKLTGDQCRRMLQSALAERFALKSHASRKVLPVYVLSVADGGIKMPKSEDQNAKSSWGAHRGWLSITNMTFDAIAQVMQRTIFDRPVLDQTGLKDRYSFILKWRADETQFSQMQGIDVPQETGTDDIEDIYTSAHRQLGIKIEARREPAPVIVIDRVSRPSPN